MGMQAANISSGDRCRFTRDVFAAPTQAKDMTLILAPLLCLFLKATATALCVKKP